VTLTLILTAPLFAAAQDVSIQQIQSSQTPRGPGPSGPPRDARPPAQTGTAAVRGRVFAADSGKPLRRARIMLQAPELGGENRTTSTNAEGKFELKDLPAARYNVVVSRSGYLQLRYGQRRPFEAGKLLQVSDKQRVDNRRFRAAAHEPHHRSRIRRNGRSDLRRPRVRDAIRLLRRQTPALAGGKRAARPHRRCGIRMR
jgi:hypothetical protein